MTQRTYSVNGQYIPSIFHNLNFTFPGAKVYINDPEQNPVQFLILNLLTKLSTSQTAQLWPTRKGRIILCVEESQNGRTWGRIVVCAWTNSWTVWEISVRLIRLRAHIQIQNQPMAKS